MRPNADRRELLAGRAEREGPGAGGAQAKAQERGAAGERGAPAGRGEPGERRTSAERGEQGTRADRGERKPPECGDVEEPLIAYLELDQLAGDRARPLPRARLSGPASIALWALRIFVIVIAALVIYTFVATLGS
jgi:hypothetical protein